MKAIGESMKQHGATVKTITCAAGALLAVTLAPAGIAHADQADDDFGNFLQSQGVHLGSPSQEVNMARVMCQDLDAGYTQKDEVDQLTGSHRLTEAQAEMFVGAATADYCPGKHNGVRPAKK